MPPRYLIRAFEDDDLATEFVNKKAKEDYRLISVTSAAVSSEENKTWPLVLRITVTMEYCPKR